MKTKLQSNGTIMPRSSAAVGCAVATFDLLEWVTGRSTIRASSLEVSSRGWRIARALANEPAILLADEPTANLDTESSNQIVDLFRELNDKGQTIIMVTHEPDIGAKGDRIIRLKDGRVV